MYSNFLNLKLNLINKHFEQRIPRSHCFYNLYERAKLWHAIGYYSELFKLYALSRKINQKTSNKE